MGELGSRSDLHREFLLKDFDAAQGSRTTYANMRLGILGAAITLLGLIASFGEVATFPSLLGPWILALAVAYIGIRMVAAANRALHAFGVYQAILERELGEVGFASCWMEHLHTDAHDTGTAAFLAACRGINISVSAYVGLSAIFGLEDVLEPSIRDAAILGVVLASFVMLALNERFVRRELDPRGFIDRIAHDLEQDRERARSRARATQEGTCA